MHETERRTAPPEKKGAALAGAATQYGYIAPASCAPDSSLSRGRRLYQRYRARLEAARTSLEVWACLGWLWHLSMTLDDHEWRGVEVEAEAERRRAGR